MRLIDADALEVQLWAHNAMVPGLMAEINHAPTIDPVHAAGGCYCRECQFAKPSTHEGYFLCTGYVNPNYVIPNGGCLEGETKEAQDA